MIYELRTYTVKQGTVQDVAKNAGTVARGIRGDDYGKLEGYWVTEIGPLNQVMHLWSYKDLNERARLRGELAKNARWNNEYLPLTRPNLIRQDIRLLNVVKRTGGAGQHRQRLRAAQLSHQARRGAAMGGPLHQGARAPREVFQDRRTMDDGGGAAQRGLPSLGVRRSQCARSRARRPSMKDPGWQEFLKSSRRAARRDALDDHAAGSALAAEVAGHVLGSIRRNELRAAACPTAARCA